MLFDQFVNRIDKIHERLQKQLDQATIQKAVEDLAKINIELYEAHFIKSTIGNNEFINLSVRTYSIRDALLLLKT